MDVLETYVDAVGIVQRASRREVVLLQKGHQRYQVVKVATRLYEIRYLGTERKPCLGYEGAIGHVNGLLMRGAEEVVE